MTKIGPKEAALKAQREEALDIPKFLKRPDETPEQEEKRRAKYRKKDSTGGLKAIEPVAPMPEKIRKAIEKDLREEPPVTKTLLQSVLAGEVSTGDALTKIGGFQKPKKEKKLPRALEKALAEKEKLNTLSQTATQNPMETPVKKPKTTKPANGKKQSKVALIVALLTRKEGCTAADVLKATGWTAVSMPAQAKAAGLKLKVEKTGKVHRYRAA